MARSGHGIICAGKAEFAVYKGSVYLWEFCLDEEDSREDAVIERVVRSHPSVLACALSSFSAGDARHSQSRFPCGLQPDVDRERCCENIGIGYRGSHPPCGHGRRRKLVRHCDSGWRVENWI